MNTYQEEQLDALVMIRRHLGELSAAETGALTAEIADYLDFRDRVADFLETHFTDICTEKCYASRLSACCSKDGIVAFWADVAVNALTAEKDALDLLEQAIRQPANDFKCIFLSSTGCLWRVKPIVCELFLCDEAERRVFDSNPAALKAWEAVKEEKKRFTWPDRPVLFEYLEVFFMNRGCASPLMYIHNSPGLLRIKKNRGRQSLF
jgi:hypothetical protein